jgi:hypothetical protein
MTALHRRLASGEPAAAALSAARAEAGGPYRFPTSAGFVCFGYG